MLPSLPRFAFVSVQTTGGSPATERIIELAILRATPDGVDEWSRLVNPERSISDAVQAGTGITRAMLAEAPIFEELAREVTGLLAGHVFVAHQARGALGALRRAFARMDAEFDVPVLCTARLSRRLFPKEKQHGLDAIVSRHGLSAGRDAADRHRALGQARLCLQFWQKLQRVFSADELEKAVNRLAAPASNPAPLSMQDDGPASPPPPETGPMILQWETLSTAFQAALMSAQARSGLPRPTGARHSGVFAWCLARDLVSGTLCLSAPDEPGLGTSNDLYGVFRSRARARHWLRELALENGLCTTHLGLDERTADPACPARRIGRCMGACLGKESAETHFQRLDAALQPFRIDPWPLKGPLLIQHKDALHVIDHWRYLGLAPGPGDVTTLHARGYDGLVFDADIYEAWRHLQVETTEPSEYR